MSTRRATCATCRHWNGRIEFGSGAPVWVAGDCRALPPAGRARWSKTEAEDWCGSHTEHHPDVAVLFAAREAILRS